MKMFIKYLICAVLWTPSAQAIVGGEPVLETDPLQKSVLLITAQEQGLESHPYTHCTAVALSSKIILTAAHCLQDKSLNFFVSRSGEQPLARKIIHHEALADYKADSSFDLALAVLDTELPLDTEFALIKPAIYGRKLDRQRSRQKVWASGFGRTSGRPAAFQDEGILRKVALEVLGSKVSHVIAVNQYGGQGICSGDSGGPLYAIDAQGFRLVGISQRVSGVPALNESEKDACSGIGKFTAVDSFFDWIMSTHQDLLQRLN